GRAERGIERVAAAGCELRDRLRVKARRPLDDRVPLDVDAPPTGTSRELGVLPRCDGHAGFAVEFLELLEHYRACRHVDAEGERLGREDDFQELALEELLDDLLERR